MFFFLLACTLEESPEIRDRESYLLSLHGDSDGLQACNAIQDSTLQGECLLFLAAQSNLGLDACDFARERLWREACYFEVVDKRGLSGAEAKRICQQTGRFQARCMYHILQREEKELMQRFPSGTEQELMRYIEEQIQGLNGAEIQNDRLSHSLVARILARRFRKRWNRDNGLVFSKDYCGSTSSNICQQAYRFVIKLEKKLPQPCLTNPNTDELKKQGFPVWRDDFNNYAQAVWREICFNQRSTSKP